MTYDAFISYSHAKDRPIAAALQSVMQSLGKAWWQRRKLNVFRDETSLTATPELWPSIENALIGSRFLVLMASPEAAAAKWVNLEVTTWLDHKGPLEGPRTLLIALTGGDLVWDDQGRDFDWRLATMALPSALKGRWTSIEPLWIDLRSYREEPAKARRSNKEFASRAGQIAARVQGVPLEDLLSEEVRNQRNALRLAVGQAAFCSSSPRQRQGLAISQRSDRIMRSFGQSKLLAKSARDYITKALPDPVTAALLALEALPDAKRGPARPYVPEAEHVLVDALSLLRERRVLAGHNGTVIHASFNRTGSRLGRASHRPMRST